MKDPDCLIDAIEESIDEDLLNLGISDSDELQAIKELRIEKIKAICSKWFEYGEYLTVEIDTDKEACVVIERSH